MRITVTLDIVNEKRKLDIQVEQSQRIKTTLRVLAENNMDFKDLRKVSTIRIKRSGRRVSIEETYEEAFIYSGMELIVEQDISTNRKKNKELVFWNNR